MGGDPLLLIFKAALVAFGLHLLCSGGLRSRIASDPALLQQLFSAPVWASSSKSNYMRVRYFWWLTESPQALAEWDLTTHALFWGARAGGGGLVLLMTIFFISAFVFSV